MTPELHQVARPEASALRAGSRTAWMRRAGLWSQGRLNRQGGQQASGQRSQREGGCKEPKDTERCGQEGCPDPRGGTASADASNEADDRTCYRQRDKDPSNGEHPNDAKDAAQNPGKRSLHQASITLVRKSYHSARSAR